MESISMDQKIELLRLAELRAEGLRDLQRYATPNAPKPIDTLAIYDEYLKRLTGEEAAMDAPDQGGAERDPNSIRMRLKQLINDFEQSLDRIIAEMGLLREDVEKTLGLIQNGAKAREKFFAPRAREFTSPLRGIQPADPPSPLPGSPPPITAQGGARKE
jgi:hypothetical protein